MTTTFEQRVTSTDYLRRLGASDLGRAYKDLALQKLALQPGDRVADLGCGPGTDLAGYADAVGPTGRVVGIDKDPDSVAAAREATAPLPHVEVMTGDIHRLPLRSASFDAVHTDRVLQHVADPIRALAELRRLLRPDGRAVLAEPDWRTLVVDHPETALSQAYTAYVVGHQIRNPRLGGELRRIAQQAGLATTGIVPVTAVFTDATRADRVLGFARVTRRVVDAGMMTSDDRRRFLTHLQSADNTFFASVTLFVAVCRVAARETPRTR